MTNSRKSSGKVKSTPNYVTLRQLRHVSIRLPVYIYILKIYFAFVTDMYNILVNFIAIVVYSTSLKVNHEPVGPADLENIPVRVQIYHTRAGVPGLQVDKL